jgi:glycerol kinase
MGRLPMKKYILALDQGTTSSRAILFDRAGTGAASAQQEFPSISRSPAGSSTTRSTSGTASSPARARSCATAASTPPRSPPSASPTSARPRSYGTAQRRADLPGHRLAGPAHGRTCDALREAGKARLISASPASKLDAYFSATKLQWLLDHVPGARERAERGELAFGTVDSWLAYKLTGRHVTDVSNASRTMLFNINSLRWDPELLALFGIPGSMLPEVVPAASRSASPARNGSAGDPGGRHRRRPAGRHLRPGLPRARHGQEYLWHRLLHADARGRHAAVSHNRLLATVGWTIDGAPTICWKAASSWAAPPCSGCATAWASSSNRATSRRWPPSCPTAAA